MTSENQINPLIYALRVIIGLVVEMRIPYMLFGRIANSLYGNPGQTFDIDIKIALDSNEKLDHLIAKLNVIGKVIPQNLHVFITDTGVLQ